MDGFVSSKAPFYVSPKTSLSFTNSLLERLHCVFMALICSIVMYDRSLQMELSDRTLKIFQ